MILFYVIATFDAFLAGFWVGVLLYDGFSKRAVFWLIFTFGFSIYFISRAVTT